MDFDLEVTAGGFIFSLLLALFVFWLAKKNQFFKLPPPSTEVPVTFTQALGSFLIYLLFAFIILPIVIVIIFYSKTGNISSVKNLPQVWMSWIQVISLWIISILLLIYCFLIPQKARHFIFWGEKSKSFKRFWKSLGMGILTTLVSYPFVLLVGLIAKFISLKLWGDTELEQSAVKQLKLSMDNSLLFTLMILAIIFVVPFAEELLFRGFFQNFLKRHFGRNWAIAISAIVFAFAHFSLSQGTGNFQLILTLCVLAFFLGFIYERERTIWASFGLHMTFNAFNIFLIILTKSAK